MKERTVIFICCILFLCLSATPVLQGQILDDTASISLLKKGADDIYNWKYDKARVVVQQLSGSYSGHPVLHLLNGMITYWENYPLTPSSPASDSYVNDMRSCIRLCEELQNQEYYPEYLMVNLGARGMLLMYYADNDLSEMVSPLAKSTYHYLRQSFDYTSFFSDFYFFTGLYNYYREAYPDAHPIYKMLAFLFPKGDIVRGLSELQMAAQNSVMLRAESLFFLSLIYTNFEYDYQEAYVSSKSLHELYPANLQYLAGYIKISLLAKKYNEAEALIRSSFTEKSNSYFEAQLLILNGILQEKEYHNNIEAKKLYNKGIADISGFGYYGNEFAAYAYFGLSRIFDSEGDKRNRKMYRKRALDLTDYKKINFDE